MGNGEYRRLSLESNQNNSGLDSGRVYFGSLLPEGPNRSFRQPRVGVSSLPRACVRTLPDLPRVRRCSDVPPLTQPPPDDVPVPTDGRDS